MQCLSLIAVGAASSAAPDSCFSTRMNVSREPETPSLPLSHFSPCFIPATGNKQIHQSTNYASFLEIIPLMSLIAKENPISCAEFSYHVSLISINL